MRPRGAKKTESNPASSSIPSDWYEEKSCAAATNERKKTVHSSVVMPRAAQTQRTGMPQRSLRAPVLHIQSAISVPAVMNIPSISPWAMKTLGR